MICFARRCHHCKWSSCFVWFSIGLNEIMIPSLCKSYPAKHALSCIFMPFMTWDQPWPSRSLAWCDMCSHQLIHDGLSWPTKHPTVSLIFSNNLLGRKKTHQTVLVGSSCNDSDAPMVWSQYRHSFQICTLKKWNGDEWNTKAPEHTFRIWWYVDILHAFLKPQISHAP